MISQRIKDQSFMFEQNLINYEERHHVTKPRNN